MYIIFTFRLLESDQLLSQLTLGHKDWETGLGLSCNWLLCWRLLAVSTKSDARFNSCRPKNQSVTPGNQWLLGKIVYSPAV